jgi:ribosomal protein L37AE/L43A
MFPAGMGRYEPCKRCNAPTGESYHGFSLHESRLVGEHETFCPSCLEAWEELCVAQLKPQAVALYQQFLADDVAPSVQAEVYQCIGCNRATTRIRSNIVVCDSCELSVIQWPEDYLEGDGTPKSVIRNIKKFIELEPQ